MDIRISFAIHLRAIRAEFAAENVVIFAEISQLKSFVCAIIIISLKQLFTLASMAIHH